MEGLQVKFLKFKEFDSFQEMLTEHFQKDEEEVTIDAIPLAVKSPMEDLDLLLWGDLKTMFEPHVETKSIGGYSTRIQSVGLEAGRIVGIKSLLDAVWITAAHVCVNAAQLELVLLVNISAGDELQKKYAK
ncbi:hypothetical protein Tco_0031503 [Tanacetum coccineum]